MKPPEHIVALSKWNQAKASLTKQPEKQTVSQTDENLSSAELEKYRNEPSIKAAEALEKLFRQAQGLPGSPPSRSYTSALNSPPVAPTYKPVVGGDPIALLEYALLVRKHVEKLNSLVPKHRQIFLLFSRRCLSWPARISKRKPFGDDCDKLIRDLQIGEDTIAKDSAARFNPKSKFGKIAWELIERIAWYRGSKPPFLFCWWAKAASALPPFNTKASPQDRKKWLAVIDQVLEQDFRDAEKAAFYLLLVTGKSQMNRKRAVFFDKIRGEFDSLWGLHRKPKE